MNRGIFLIVLVGAFLVACKKKTPEKAFYYWKTRFSLTPADEKLLSSLHAKKLYIRLFDIDWDKAKQNAVPKGKIRFVSQTPKKISIVPVIYITNKTLLSIKPDSIKSLAGKVFEQITYIANRNNLAYSELQFDCDWSESTRAPYFAFLGHIRQLLGNKKTKLSATIRLHQVKYYKLSGIPPVERGMLMYYNMGKIDTVVSNNSIYNASDASKYIDYLRNYPLPLDLVLPAFSWGVHIRKGKVIGLLNNLSSADFKNNINFKTVCSNQFQVTNSFFYKGFYLMRDDLIKVEEITPEVCKQAALHVSKKIKTPATVVFYHLDSLNLTNYEQKDFEEIFNYFR